MPTLRQVVFRSLQCQFFCLLLGGGLLLLSGCGESTPEPVTKAVPEKASGVPVAPIANQFPVHQEMAEDEQIRQLFVALQAANLDENIDAFMSHYADSFPAREQKLQTTLINWQKYDFGSLDFFIFALKIEGKIAEAAVGWEIALLEAGAATPHLIETTHQVRLIKSAPGWQIVSLQ